MAVIIALTLAVTADGAGEEGRRLFFLITRSAWHASEDLPDRTAPRANDRRRGGSAAVPLVGWPPSFLLPRSPSAASSAASRRVRQGERRCDRARGGGDRGKKQVLKWLHRAVNISSSYSLRRHTASSELTNVPNLASLPICST